MVYILIGICLIGAVLFIVFSKKDTTQIEHNSIEQITSNSIAVSTIKENGFNELSI